MTKHILFIAILFVITSSCVKNNVDKKIDDIVINDNFKMTKDYVVPVKSGFVTIVKRGADTLCITDIPNQTIQIPKTDNGVVSATKADDENDDVEVIFTPNYEIDNYRPNTLRCEQDYLLFFEETKEGDFDYNDLVIYVRLYHYYDMNRASKETYLLLKPVAYGATKKIAFGIEGENNSSLLITDNVQRDLFLNKDPFTNTKGSFVEVIPTDYSSSFYGEETTLNNGKVNAVIHKNKAFNNGGWFEILISNYGYQYCVNGYASFYILVDGNKFYNASASSIPGSYPYGIAIPDGRYWLKETISVDKGYKMFNNWATNGYPASWYYKNEYLNKSNFYNEGATNDYLRWNWYFIK